jgi:hypothetical protein
VLPDDVQWKRPKRKALQGSDVGEVRGLFVQEAVEECRRIGSNTDQVVFGVEA